METKALWSAWASDLMSYARSRLPAHIYLPLAVFLTTAGQVTGRLSDALALFLEVALAAGLLIQLRLWDDLADRERDQIDHPERVLARASSVRPYRNMLLLLFALNSVGVAFLRPPAFVGVFIALNGIFCLWYWAQAGLAGTVAGAHFVLLKYPAFVFLLHSPSPDAALSLISVLLLVYLCFGIYELLHDPKLGAARSSRALLAAEMAAMVAVAALMASESHGLAGSVASTLLGAAVLAWLLWRHMAGLAPGLWRFAVFAVCFTWLVSFSFGSRLLGGSS